MRTKRALLVALAAASLACDGSDPAPPPGPSWTLAETAAEFADADPVGALDCCQTDLALDGAGQPLFVYSDLLSFDTLRMARWSAPSWAELGNYLDQPRAGGGVVAATRAADGEPVRVWIDFGTNAVRAARWTGTAWSDLGTAIPSSMATFVRATEGPAGPVIAWFDASTAALGYEGRVARWDGADWLELGTPRPVFRASTADAASLSLAVGADGNPVVAYTGASGSIHVERWDGATTAWIELPAPPADPPDAASPPENVSVAVDGSGAIYLATSCFGAGTLVTYAVHRLGPGASAWSSLGLPPDYAEASSVMALHGLAGAGFFAGWTTAGAFGGAGGWPALARWTPAGWERVVTSHLPEWAGDTRPVIRPVSDTDVWFGFDDGNSFHATRWRAAE